jgi:hypothetical protein
MVDIKGCLECLLVVSFSQNNNKIKTKQKISGFPSQRTLSTKQNPGASTGLGSRAGAKVCQG